MSFVYPAFLWALAALSIPIIIHLFNFRRYKTVYFPDISFLKEVKQETDSRSKIKHWLVLLMRLLAISFLVFAFAQPFIKHQTQIERAGKKSISSSYRFNRIIRFDHVGIYGHAYNCFYRRRRALFSAEKL